MIRYCTILILLILAFGYQSYAQQAETLSNFISNQLTTIQSKKINEKVYVHLDRRSYQSGEELWLKAYVLSNYDHKLSFLSKVLTVGLLNEKEESVLETSFDIKGGRASGGINLPEELKTGNYVLYAYSGWMKKDETSAVFYTQIQVENSNASALQASISLNKDQFDDGDNIGLAVIIKDNDEEPVKKEEFTVAIYDLDQTYFSESFKTDKEGKISINAKLPDEVRSVVKVDISNEALGTIAQQVIPMSTFS
ncbi:MAG: hypothetical protein AAGC88_05930 [Bacteroidota bacterium]